MGRVSAPRTGARDGTFYLCDFDGTVATADVGNRFFRAFTRDPGRWGALIEDWRAGRLTGREVLAAECALASVSEPAAHEFVAEVAIDPAFPGFVAAARRADGEVAIASDGLLFYIRRTLDRYGLAHVPASANRLRFEGTRLVPEFAMGEGEGCGGCGNCKAEVLARLGRGHGRTVFVGDGLSDRCGARAAAVVYAKGELLDWCRSEGLAVRSFAGFADVARAEGLSLEEQPA